jgi:hypothetical protein
VFTTLEFLVFWLLGHSHLTTGASPLLVELERLDDRAPAGRGPCPEGLSHSCEWSDRGSEGPFLALVKVRSIPFTSAGKARPEPDEAENRARSPSRVGREPGGLAG